MIDLTRTTSVLLDQLRDAANTGAWQELDRRYRPIIAGLSRKAGLNEADAEDVAQETLADVFRGYSQGRYQRSKGRLRAWLIGIARFKIVDAQRRAARSGSACETQLAAETSEDEWSQAFASELRAAVLLDALSRLRESGRIEPRNLSAFELVAIRGVPASEAAASLGMSSQEVYLAKSRCLERIRTIIQEIEAAYEQD